jgi:hypothetical protein
MVLDAVSELREQLKVIMAQQTVGKFDACMH